MPVADVKGLPRYTKVIDASAQDDNPNLDFTEGKGIRIAQNAMGGAVAAKDYSTAALGKAEKAKAATAKENANLQAELAKARAEIAALKGEKPAGSAEEETPVVSPVDPAANTAPVVDPPLAPPDPQGDSNISSSGGKKAASNKSEKGDKL